MAKMAVCNFIQLTFFDVSDSDGDVVTISSDEELVEALDQFEGSIFHLYLKKSNGVMLCY